MIGIKIEIQKKFWEAFLYFLRALRYEKLNFTLEDISVPQFLIKKSYLVPTSKKEVKMSWQTPLLFIAAFGLFSYYWLVFYKNILHVLKLLRAEREFLVNITLEIPKYTHYNWDYEKILVYPFIGKWAAERLGKVYLGITPISLSDYERRWIIVHELVHINTSKGDRMEIGNQLVNLDLADELAVVVITRMIQKDAFNVSADDLQVLTNPLGDMISEEELASLETIAARRISFPNLLIYCDKMLSDKLS